MNALFLQCGAPTAVINGSLAAALRRLRAAHPAAESWGAQFGIHGLVTGRWTKLSGLAERQLELLEQQPGAALGGGRYPLTDEGAATAVARLRQYDIDCVFFLGGNGTMAAAAKLAEAAGGDLRVAGIPKTIDNDLVATHTAPGYGSAARTLALAVRSVGLDMRAMRHKEEIAVVETMGRHVGWLTAATALARALPDDPPHLILLPEAPVTEEALLAAVTAAHRRHGYCVIATTEGALTAAGVYYAQQYGELPVDAQGQPSFGWSPGVSSALAGLFLQRLGLHTRRIRLDMAQRSAGINPSPADQALARLLAITAADAALGGASGFMAAVEASSDDIWPTLVPLAAVAGQTRHVPPEWIAATGLDVMPALIDYVRPLADLPLTPIVDLSQASDE
jgi:ATP-dependent phosphofructokinase / diphosphate-dependent phosphofructokinase